MLEIREVDCHRYADGDLGRKEEGCRVVISQGVDLSSSNEWATGSSEWLDFCDNMEPRLEEAFLSKSVNLRSNLQMEIETKALWL